MENNNVHNIDATKTYLTRERLLAEETNRQIGNIKFEEVEKLLQAIPKIHHSIIEQAVRDRNYQLLGVTVAIALSQSLQSNIKKALFP